MWFRPLITRRLFSCQPISPLLLLLPQIHVEPVRFVRSQVAYMRATNTHTYIIHGSTNERQLRQARVTTDKVAPLTRSLASSFSCYNSKMSSAAAVTETAATTVTPTRVFVLSPPPEERERPALLVRLSECLGCVVGFGGGDRGTKSVTTKVKVCDDIHPIFFHRW